MFRKLFSKSLQRFLHNPESDRLVELSIKVIERWDCITNSTYNLQANHMISREEFNKWMRDRFSGEKVDAYLLLRARDEEVDRLVKQVEFLKLQIENMKSNRNEWFYGTKGNK